VVPTTVAHARRLNHESDKKEDTTMAEGQRMTVADVVAQTRDGRLEDFVREAVVLVARELMGAEISGEIGAELGEVAPEVPGDLWFGGLIVGPTETRGRVDALPPITKALSSSGPRSSPSSRSPSTEPPAMVTSPHCGQAPMWPENE
jgi:hypothetical protein